ncbi:histidine kinase dimerization/phospho-acceptor domain-containing protein [Bradyrhizobium guangxiense]
MSGGAGGWRRSNRGSALPNSPTSIATRRSARLTASIAHELNQPLGAILTNAETAELILRRGSPDLVEISEIIADIRRDDQRASEVIRRLRSMLRKAPFEPQGYRAERDRARGDGVCR